MTRENPDNRITIGKKLLIVDDEENMRHMLSTLLGKSGYRIDTATDGLDAVGKIKQSTFDFILCDIKMPQMDGMEFLTAAKEYLAETTVIMMSAYGSIDVAIEAMKLGAYDYIAKPFKADEVYLTLKKAEERESLKRENIRLKEKIRNIEETYQFGKMIGKSKSMLEIFKLGKKVAQYDTTVLITGESGTGKELIAKAIHLHGKRADEVFVPVNCGSIPETLLESEFFGYKKGAFTGADRDKKGLFEETTGGTIFLDEIGELPLALQVKLLRVLQENEVRPLGDSKPRFIDVRVIAATARDLESEVKKGNFRQDLFYRLNVMPIKLPPLRDRIEDIPILSHFFLKKFSRLLSKHIKGISAEAMELLLNYTWPGNVRELENVVERAVVLAEELTLLPENLPPEIGASEQDDLILDEYDGYSLKVAQRIIEKKLIIKALKKTGGNRTKAIELLQISHPSLLSKIKAYNIPM